MGNSTTKNVRLASIADKGKLGSVLIRLMMVMNDMSLAMDGLGLWINDNERPRQRREVGARSNESSLLEPSAGLATADQPLYGR
jgi:hypothetical protein